MKNIGQKVRELRFVKGLSQEELAIQSGLSIRTIQRIEKGDSIPHGHTLQRLCDVFKLNIDDLVLEKNQTITSTKSSVQIIYFLILIGIIVPLGNIIGPLIGWSVHKKNSELINQIGKNIILTQVIYSLLSTGITMYAIFIKLGNQDNHFEMLMLGVLGLFIVNYGLALYAGIKDEEKKIYLPFLN